MEHGRAGAHADQPQTPRARGRVSASSRRDVAHVVTLMMQLLRVARPGAGWRQDARFLADGQRNVRPAFAIELLRHAAAGIRECPR